MGVVLPDEAAWVLDLIGVEWPNVDEDDYRDMADGLRSFGSQVRESKDSSERFVREFLENNEGPATAAFEQHWGKVSGTHLERLAEAADLGAIALDGAAIAVAGAKVAAIVQLGILAAEIIAAQAAAPFTLGLSEVGALGATQATRVIVRRLLKEAEHLLVEELMAVVTGPVYSALGSMATDLVIQVGSNAVGLQDGYSAGKTLHAGSTGLSDGLESAAGTLTGRGGAE
ncbi:MULTISPECIES: WXG100-like domain-containing protein [unclassified Streptomyces]|uniref:WXG100-like domain-containing protein n=1 Tax=unclassified Streptomyces TaxID=2593676 RepID=UPI002E191BFC